MGNFFFQQSCLSIIFGWPKCKHLKEDQLQYTRISQCPRFYRYATVQDLHQTQYSTLHLKQGPTCFPLTSIGHKLKNDRLQSQDMASEYILKEIYFTPQNKKRKKRIGIRDVVHWECIDNCSLHFFGVSSEKKC